MAMLQRRGSNVSSFDLWDPFRLLFGERELEGREPGMFIPDIEVRESDDGFVLSADLPGVGADDVDVSLQNNRLTITGTRKSEEKKEGERFHFYERSFGSFSRSLVLPESADPEQIDADMKDGVLTIHIPKRKEASARKIKVGATEAKQGLGAQAPQAGLASKSGTKIEAKKS